VIARLHPQLSHLCGEGFQSVSDGGSRYILQRESDLFLYTTPSNRFIIVFPSASPRKYTYAITFSTSCSHVPTATFRFLNSMSSQILAAEPRAQSPSIRSESGYASGSSSQDSLPEVYFSKPHLKFLNAQLQKLEPQGEWPRNHYALSLG
jgi:hypothetical protein